MLDSELIPRATDSVPGLLGLLTRTECHRAELLSQELGVKCGPIARPSAKPLTSELAGRRTLETKGKRGGQVARGPAEEVGW